jgi:hypothetical protein
MAASSEGQYPLHECVFSGNVRKLSSLLRSHDVSAKDKYGESASTLPRRRPVPLAPNFASAKIPFRGAPSPCLHYTGIIKCEIRLCPPPSCFGAGD